MNNNLIVIGGGVGPLAGVKTAEQLVENTKAKTDQDHPQWHLVNADVSDRTTYLLDEKYRKNNDSPAVGMAESIRASIAGSQQEKIITGVPCNTFHAFADEYKENLSKISEDTGKEIVFVDMIHETAKMISELLPNIETIGVMSTTGTREIGIYKKVLGDLRIKMVEVDDERQEELHDTIYNEEWGIKSSTHDSQKTQENFESYANELKEKGAEALILGCTEIPLALRGKNYKGMPLVDPVTALVRGLLQEATNGEKLKPLDKKGYLSE